MKRITLFGAVLAMLFLAGCGGGSSSGNEFLTREAEASLDRDALALASRESTGMRIPLSLAQRIDKDLREARAAFSVLNTAHVRVDNSPVIIRFALYENAPWLSAWEAGNWRTGVPAIDNVLAPLHVASVRKVSASDGKVVFDLTFSQWVRTKAVAFTLYDKSPSIQSVGLVPATDGVNIDPDNELGYGLINSGILSITGGGVRVDKIDGVWTEFTGGIP